MRGYRIERQQISSDTLKTSDANGNQVARLTEIGMTWDKPVTVRTPQPSDRLEQVG